MNKIFYIIGKSASGKDSIYQALLERPELSLKKLVLYTTRPQRTGEENGREYYFVTEEKRQQYEQQGKIIEQRDYHTVYGIWSYFTVDDGQVNLSEHSYLGIGTLESYQKLCRYYGEEKVAPLYIEVEDGERLLRSIYREKKEKTPHYEEMCRRFLADQEDFSEAHLREAKIKRRFENKDFEECIGEILAFLCAE